MVFESVFEWEGGEWVGGLMMVGKGRRGFFDIGG